MTQFGKRELNKAQTRINTLNAVYRLSAGTDFSDLKVTEIAGECGITEMTFFNYFKRKEDILKYMMGVWGLEVLVLQHRHPLQGEDAIRRVFSHTAKHVKKHPRLIANFVATVLTRDITPNAHEIEPADRFLLFPELLELHNTPIPSGNEILMQHLAEIDPDGDHMGTLLQLASAFYGDIIVALTARMDVADLYTRSLDTIFLSPQSNG